MKNVISHQVFTCTMLSPSPHAEPVSKLQGKELTVSNSSFSSIKEKIHLIQKNTSNGASIGWCFLSCPVIGGPFRPPQSKSVFVPGVDLMTSYAALLTGAPFTNSQLCPRFSPRHHTKRFVLAHKTQSPLSPAFTTNNWDVRAGAAPLRCKWRWELGDWLAEMAS